MRRRGRNCLRLRAAPYALPLTLQTHSCLQWFQGFARRQLRVPVTVNRRTARYEPDGSVRIVVAASDPGLGNWMSTDGHRFGATGLRWNQATEDVEPDVRVIAI